MSPQHDTDPRGPERRITGVDESKGPTLVTLSCGHVREFVNHYCYRVGDPARCFACRKEGL